MPLRWVEYRTHGYSSSKELTMLSLIAAAALSAPLNFIRDDGNGRLWHETGTSVRLVLQRCEI